MSCRIKFSNVSLPLQTVSWQERDQYPFPVIDPPNFSEAFIMADRMMKDGTKPIVMWAPRTRPKNARERFAGQKDVLPYIQQNYPWHVVLESQILKRRIFLPSDCGAIGNIYRPHCDWDDKSKDAKRSIHRRAIYTPRGYGSLVFPFAQLNDEDFAGAFVKHARWGALGPAFRTPAGGALFLATGNLDQVVHCAQPLVNYLPHEVRSEYSILRDTFTYFWSIGTACSP